MVVDGNGAVSGLAERLADPAPGQRPLENVTLEEPVLVAVDMSASSRAALLWAGEYATRAGQPLIVLHVLHDPPEAPGRYSRNGLDPLEPAFDTAERMLAEFLAEAVDDHPELESLADVSTKVVRGLPAGTIVDQALRLKAKLVVLGSRGQTGIAKILFGSTAQKVVQQSPIAVTVIKAPTTHSTA